MKECACSCCIEHRNLVAHNRDRSGCNCDFYQTDEQCECTYCVAAMAFRAEQDELALSRERGEVEHDKVRVKFGLSPIGAKS